jgi:flagellum-specific ATP synthase
VDEALRLGPRIEAFLSQRKDEPVLTVDDTFASLAELLAQPDAPA